jgi:DNA-binding transcriptional LysR family regulator
MGLSAPSNKDVGGEAQMLGDPMAAALRSDAVGLQRVVPDLVDSTAVVVEKGSSVMAQVKGTWKIQRRQLLRSSSWITVLAMVLDGMGMVTCPSRFTLSRACMPQCCEPITLQLYGPE